MERESDLVVRLEASVKAVGQTATATAVRTIDPILSTLYWDLVR